MTVENADLPHSQILARSRKLDPSDPQLIAWLAKAKDYSVHQADLSMKHEFWVVPQDLVHKGAHLVLAPGRNCAYCSPVWSDDEAIFAVSPELKPNKTTLQCAILDDVAELWSSCDTVLNKLSTMKDVDCEKAHALREGLGWSGAGAGCVRERMDIDPDLAGEQFEEINKETGWLKVVRHLTISLVCLATPVLKDNEELAFELEVIQNAADLLAEKIEAYYSQS